MVTSHVLFGKLYASNMQMQVNYGASDYFLETGGTNKRKHVETLKFTEVSASDKLKSFRASQERYEYRWADSGEIKKPITVSAPKYVDYLMDWIAVQLDDEKILPQKLGIR
ncbi:hypothetical protein GIB67_028091 [Kingdonia uniflora]|uniref:Uncharacterized protein n=1 Tax=Kingdonia uniflora TaxID=39325 RepID=A0A7J7NR65_9MAGN|nr:hypothetical protein GIB67_028091 [Kingdonia uniflora]